MIYNKDLAQAYLSVIRHPTEWHLNQLEKLASKVLSQVNNEHFQTLQCHLDNRNYDKLLEELILSRKNPIPTFPSQE